MKQTHGHVFVSGSRVLVLVRSTKYGRSLKMRKSGAAGIYFADETAALEVMEDKAGALIAGETIYL